MDYRDDGFTAGPTERGFLVGASARRSRPLIHIDESLDELALLADTAGIKVVGRAIQHMNQIDPATYIGSGKAEEIREEVASLLTVRRSFWTFSRSTLIRGKARCKSNWPNTNIACPALPVNGRIWRGKQVAVAGAVVRRE